MGVLTRWNQKSILTTTSEIADPYNIVALTSYDSPILIQSNIRSAFTTTIPKWLNCFSNRFDRDQKFACAKFHTTLTMWLSLQFQLYACRLFVIERIGYSKQSIDWHWFWYQTKMNEKPMLWQLNMKNWNCQYASTHIRLKRFSYSVCQNSSIQTTNKYV